MPANLTPDYMKAEKWFREATTDEEKILALEEMMRVIPKHKGTDHMRAELRRKYSALKESSEKRKKASHGLDFFHIPKSGSGQVVLLGLPNSGKSAKFGEAENFSLNNLPGFIKFGSIYPRIGLEFF